MRNELTFLLKNVYLYDFHYEQSSFVESNSNYRGYHLATSFTTQIKARMRPSLHMPTGSNPSFQPVGFHCAHHLCAVFDQPRSCSWWTLSTRFRCIWLSFSFDRLPPHTQLPFSCSFKTDFRDSEHQKQFYSMKYHPSSDFSLSSVLHFLFALFS